MQQLIEEPAVEEGLVTPAETAEATAETPPEGEATAEAPASTEQKPAEAVNWETRFNELKESSDGRIAKLESDLNAQRGNILAQTERDAGIVNNVGDRIDGLERTFAAFVKAYSSGDAEGLPGEVAQINQETAQRQNVTSFNRVHNALFDQLETAMEGSGLDLQTSPELAALRTQWNAAQEAGDAGELGILLSEGHRIARQAERVINDQKLADANTAAVNQVEEAKEEAGVLDLAVPGGTGAAESKQSRLKRLGAGEPMTSAEMVQAAKDLEDDGVGRIGERRQWQQAKQPPNH